MVLLTPEAPRPTLPSLGLSFSTVVSTVAKGSPPQLAIGDSPGGLTTRLTPQTWTLPEAAAFSGHSASSLGPFVVLYMISRPSLAAGAIAVKDWLGIVQLANAAKGAAAKPPVFSPPPRPARAATVTLRRASKGTFHGSMVPAANVWQQSHWDTPDPWWPKGCLKGKGWYPDGWQGGPWSLGKGKGSMMW